MEYSESASAALGSSALAGKFPTPPPLEQPLSAKLAQSLTLAESLAEQVTRIADGVTGPRPSIDNAKAASVDTNLFRQADALASALARLSNQVDRLNSTL